MAIQMQIRRDSSSTWTSVNPILAEGELGFEINSGKVKVGNGILNWNSLPYITSNLEIITSNLQAQINNIASNTDPTYLDSLTEIIANVNARFQNIAGNSLVNGSHLFTLTATGNLDLPNNSILNSLLSTTINSPLIDIKGETFITGNLLPTGNVIYDLGSSTARFKDIWLSNSTIHLGSTSISSDGSGQLVIGQKFDFGGEGFGGVSYIYWNSSNDIIDNSSPHLMVRINPNSSFLDSFKNITKGSVFTVTAGSTANVVTLGSKLTVTGTSTIVTDAPWLNVYIPINSFYTGIGHNPGGNIHGAYVHTFNIQSSSNKDPEIQANVATLINQQNKLVADNGNVFVTLNGGTDPFVAFPPTSDGSRLEIVGSEILSASGNLTLTSRSNLYLLSNSLGIGGGSNLWNFDYTGNLIMPQGGDILNFNGQSVLGGSPTGNLIIGDCAINFVASSSGDTYSLSTIELVPDNNAYANGQYLIIDPTYPNHIHIRAGGTIGTSLSKLILGGEDLRLTVWDDDGTAGIYNSTVQNISYTLYNSGSADFTLGTFADLGGNVGTITMTVVSQAVLNSIWALNSLSEVVVNDGTSAFTLKPDGNTSTPGVGQTAVFGVTRIEGLTFPVNGANLTQIGFDINQTLDTKIEVDGPDVRIEAADDVRIFSRDVLNIGNYSVSTPVRIITRYSNDELAWNFTTDGNLILPQTDMNASPAPTSLPGITFTDGTRQTTAFTGNEFPSNIVNEHGSGSATISVGGLIAVKGYLKIRLSNNSSQLAVEVNYDDPAANVLCSAFRIYPSPVNLGAGTFAANSGNTTWSNFGNLAGDGDSLAFMFSDNSFHKIYRVTVIARSMPSGSGVGDAYCVIEQLK